MIRFRRATWLIPFFVAMGGSETPAARLAVLAVDTSQTMREKERWLVARELADTVVKQDLGEGDTCFLLTFQDRADEVATYRLQQQSAALRAALELSVAKPPRGRSQASFTCVRDFALKFFSEHPESAERLLFLITDGAPTLKSELFRPDKPRGGGPVRLYLYRYRSTGPPSEPPSSRVGLRLQPLNLSLRDGRWDLGAAEAGEGWRPEFRLEATPASATTVQLTVELSDLSGPKGPLPGQQADVKIEASGQAGRNVTVDFPAEGMTVPVALSAPPSGWSWRSTEELTGKLRLVATAASQSAPKEWSGEFVATRRTDVTTAAIVAAVVGAATLLAIALLCLLLMPKTVTLSLAAQPLTAKQFSVPGRGEVTLGGDPEGFPLPGTDRQTGVLKRKGFGWQVCPIPEVRVGEGTPGAACAVRSGVPFALYVSAKRVDLEFRLGPAQVDELAESPRWR